MLKKIVNIRLSAANWLILSFLTVLATACSISYKFNGASIDLGESLWRLPVCGGTVGADSISARGDLPV